MYVYDDYGLASRVQGHEEGEDGYFSDCRHDLEVGFVWERRRDIEIHYVNWF